MNWFLRYKTTTVLLILLALWFGISAYRAHLRWQSIHEEAAKTQESVSTLQKENDRMTRFANYFKSVAYLEKQARIKLNYKAPDEQVVFIHPGEESNTGEEGGAAMLQRPLYREWIRYVLRR